jgi:hypothetical protein
MLRLLLGLLREYYQVCKPRGKCTDMGCEQVVARLESRPARRARRGSHRRSPYRVLGLRYRRLLLHVQRSH